MTDEKDAYENNCIQASRIISNGNRLYSVSPQIMGVCVCVSM